MSSDEFVYILSNISYPDDLFKIGSTRVSPSNRAYQLQSSGVPTPFTVEYVILTPNCRDLEQKIHRHLNNFRVSHRREFFKIDKGNLYKILTDEMTLQLIPFSEFHYSSKPTHATQTEPETEPDTDPESEHENMLCSICNISCSDKYSYQKHCESARHIANSINPTHGFEYCGKRYQYMKSMKFHQKNCKKYLKTVSMQETDNNQLVERIVEMEKDAQIKDLQIENLKNKLEIAQLKATNVTNNITSNINITMRTK
jgi:hypothetical protein